MIFSDNQLSFFIKKTLRCATILVGIFIPLYFQESTYLKVYILISILITSLVKTEKTRLYKTNWPVPQTYVDYLFIGFALALCFFILKNI